MTKSCGISHMLVGLLPNYRVGTPIEKLSLFFNLFPGKGMTDQDRNILSNQLLLLGFLRSAANFLTLGPKPSVTSSKKKKQKDSDDEGEADNGSENGNQVESTSSHTTRGTILVTLRNVSPYTLWYAP